MNILLISGLSDKQLLSKTKVFLNLTEIENVYLFRRRGNIYSNSPKVKTIYPYKNYQKKWGILNKVLFDCYNFIGYSLYFFLGKIDVVVGIYLYPYGLYASFLGIIFQKPVILVLPGSDLKKLVKTKRGINLFKKSKFIGVRGLDSFNKLVSLGFSNKSLFVLNNIFDINKYSYNLNIKKKYDIIFTGYFKRGKRIEIILYIVERLKKSWPDITCVLIGQGEQEVRLIELARELRIENNVQFVGYKDNVEFYLQSSKVYILTSEYEGLPMSMIEAMGCCLPVVVSNINDIPDVINHGENGFLVEPGNIDDYVKYCHLLLTEENLRYEMGKKARLTIERLYNEKYSYDAVSKVWTNILNKIEIKN